VKISIEKRYKNKNNAKTSKKTKYKSVKIQLFERLKEISEKKVDIDCKNEYTMFRIIKKIIMTL